MRSWLRGRVTALIAFLLISALVTGGLGWATAEALRLEQEQFGARAEAERAALLRPALWQLDSRVWPFLAREDSRPYSHYAAVYPPPVLFRTDETPIEPGTVLEPSPLQGEDLPRWMALHFHVDAEQGWASPQVLSQRLTHILNNPKARAPLENVTDEREELRRQMAGCVNPLQLMCSVRERSEQQRQVSDQVVLLQNGQAINPAQTLSNSNNNDIEQQTEKKQSQAGQSGSYGNANRGNKDDFASRLGQQVQLQKDVQFKQQEAESGLAANYQLNGENWFSVNPTKPAFQRKPAVSKKTIIKVGPMVPLWLTPEDHEERLLVARLVQVGDKQVCQGIILDRRELESVLTDVVKDDFPDARFEPQRHLIPPHPERTMTALPIQMDPGPLPMPEVGSWTPLRVGLGLAWAAALVALSAVGLGGSTLLDLSERRIRFVSAVTHELRTPLTTLRLYLDMMAGGLVRDEERQAEYLQTLHAETDRLHRLVGNVLDFSRLENQRPRLERTTVATADLLEQVHANWQGRCRSTDKDLIVEDQLGDGVQLTTDVNLVQQVLGNLIDNACKYSKGADDRRIWLRAKTDGPKRLVLEVEDRGPGVPVREQHSIFRAFRRGRGAEEVAGGVGLGLALARQWARLLGGRLTVSSGAGATGACFRLELPTG